MDELAPRVSVIEADTRSFTPQLRRSPGHLGLRCLNHRGGQRTREHSTITSIGFRHRDNYRIGSTRHGDTPICIIGQAEVAGAGGAAGAWYAPHELEDLRGLIGNAGDPPRLQAVVHDEGFAIHLIGYDTEAEVVTAATSLR